MMVFFRLLLLLQQYSLSHSSCSSCTPSVHYLVQHLTGDGQSKGLASEYLAAKESLISLRSNAAFKMRKSQHLCDIST